ncbi:glycosyltransferase family 1 protein [Apiospora aurea]|uniref:Glycosyltransferase family 1 protein n=1 Tax=Apiospora aurea TaxID=335848 RepID=A0ABR1QLG3_9PEZI
MPWITKFLPEVSTLFDYIPPNVTCVGFLILSSSPARVCRCSDDVSRKIGQRHLESELLRITCSTLTP